MKRDPTIFDRYDVVSSPSQLSDFLDCPRKWWFRRVARLPLIQNEKKFVFGNVLHGAIQRWLEADDTGRDSSGKKADLYPEGWAEGVTKGEIQIVQMLMKAAVDSGLLRRTPGRKVEHEFEIELVPGVGYVGALDVDTCEGVEDHKSSKARKWISTEDALAADPKMLSYAKIWFDEDSNQEADSCKLRLNYMVKDPKDLYTKPVEVIVAREDIEAFWADDVIPAGRSMLAMKKSRAPVTEWHLIEGPRAHGACKKYGGCAFAGICARMKTPRRYIEEIERANGVLSSVPVKPTRKPGMAIFGKKKSKKSPAPETEVAEAPETEVEVAEAVAAPPWANPKCMACKGTGINTKQGRACRACDAVAARKGEETSESYELVFDEDGGVTWVAQDGSSDPEVEDSRVVVQAKPKAAKAKPVTRKKAAVKKPKVKPAPPAAEDVEPEQEVVKPQKVDSGGFDSSAAGGFRLFINAIPIVSTRKTIDLAHVLQNEGAELADSKGADSFYLLDAFKRRDMLASQAGIVAKDFVGCDVFCVGANQDLKDYCQAMRQFATEVVVGTF